VRCGSPGGGISQFDGRHARTGVGGAARRRSGAAVRALTLALSNDAAAPDDATGPESKAVAARRGLTQTLLRARIMAGDIEQPLSQARELVKAMTTPPTASSTRCC